MENQKSKNIISIVLKSLMYVAISVLLLFLVLAIMFNRSSDGATSVFGHQMRIVISPSMEASEFTDVSNFEIKSLPVNTMVFIEEVPENPVAQAEWYKNLKVGDVLTFKYFTIRQDVITHRIVKIEENDRGGYLITLEGDNKDSDGGTVSQQIDTSNVSSPNYVIGKVVGHSYILGLVLTGIRSTVGLVIIIVVVVVFLVLEVIRLIRILTEDKREAEKRKRQEELDELEELRKKVALLEGQNSNNEG